MSRPPHLSEYVQARQFHLKSLKVIGAPAREVCGEAAAARPLVAIACQVIMNLVIPGSRGQKFAGRQPAK